MLLKDLKAIGGYLEPRHFICISISRRRASTYMWDGGNEPVNPRVFSLYLSYSDIFKKFQQADRSIHTPTVLKNICNTIND